MTATSTVVITGAAGNLGKAVAERLGESGANLVLIGHNQDKLDAAFPELSGTRMTFAVDLLDREATVEAIETARNHFGSIDGLCATAGGFHMGESVHETTAETWQKMQDLNVGTLLNTLHAVVPAMLAGGQGRIVTVGANGALKGAAKMGAYCAAKSSVMRITESVAAELGSKGIAANCVLPAIIDTPENRAAMPKADPAKWTTPQAIASTVSFLLSDEAGAINGALVPVTA